MKPSDLSKMTRQQLQNLARRKKISVSSNLLKNEMVSKIGRELRKQEKQKAAGGKGPAGKTSAKRRPVPEKPPPKNRHQKGGRRKTGCEKSRWLALSRRHKS
ncbi:hypothetical protein NITGR_130035 [Nitrospina gracilis 3/211]|uniref:Uncharacterized protein n=1 Tax=Nitrospina gracilis (strain 3/211) TaxID=1266370 RepID=M1YW95_NITG3|nr:hypothetical protein NITGR_130035 [Nitrospina gracilis 3/211]